MAYAVRVRLLVNDALADEKGRLDINSLILEKIAIDL